MENFLTPRKDIEKTYTYEELCKEVSLLLGIDLPVSFEEFIVLDKEYLINICSKYIMDKDQKKSNLASYINKYFNEHKLIASHKNEINWSRRPPLPWSYSWYHYEIKRALHITIPTPPNKKKFTQALFQELLWQFQQDDNSYESVIAHHWRFFVSDYVWEELKNILQEKELLQWRKNKYKKNFTNEVMWSQKVELQEHNHTGLTQERDITHTSQSVIITNQSHNISVSESDFKLIQWFLKIISSRSTSNTNATFLEAVLSVLEDNLSGSEYWKEKLVMYMIDWKLDLQKIKKTFEYKIYTESNIYKFIRSFQQSEQWQ